MKRYSVILSDDFGYADYHVLAEDKKVAVSKAISEHCKDDSEERQGGTVLRSPTATTRNFRLSQLVQVCKKIKQAVSNQQP